MKILILEDNAILAQGLKTAIEEAGYCVDLLLDGMQGIAWLKSGQYDLLMLDLGLPGMDGIEILRYLRRQKNTIPVIIITARDRLDQRITGLEEGADDYLCKPFSLEEVVARVRAVIRRSRSFSDNRLKNGEVELCLASRTLTLNGEIVTLHRRELAVLEYFMLNRGRLLSKDQVVDSIASLEQDISAGAIETYVSRIRKKLGTSVAIRTVRGLGYMMESLD
ncbi:DNA-binding response regulator [Nitrincola tibetensis]|uniref:DNA-binding response regulator n=1 Tax=Nitrincola tibetensis TaxID=2219697 RepID=A0A364NNS0_9GAMM|nr:response regulator transcription factor [Nitrincola tibetensis]RAU18746.1 DNA-binding response regulator [Nitrincola tibetensis]